MIDEPDWIFLPNLSVISVHMAPIAIVNSLNIRYRFSARVVISPISFLHIYVTDNWKGINLPLFILRINGFKYHQLILQGN